MPIGFKLVLASGSPRRRELLQSLGLDFVVRPADIDETARADEPPTVLVERLAVEKAEAKAEGKHLVIGADTLVIDGVEALGKPTDVDDARSMLERLSGRSHRVVSGIAVVCNGQRLSSITSTPVQFQTLEAEDVDWYLDGGEWAGKAGAYAIQGAGGLLVDGITGNYQNVVGLPLTELDRLLGRFGRPLKTWMA